MKFYAKTALLEQWQVTKYYVLTKNIPARFLRPQGEVRLLTNCRDWYIIT